LTVFAELEAAQQRDFSPRWLPPLRAGNGMPFGAGPSVFKVPYGSRVHPADSQPRFPVAPARNCLDSITPRALFFKAQRESGAPEKTSPAQGGASRGAGSQDGERDHAASASAAGTPLRSPALRVSVCHMLQGVNRVLSLGRSADGARMLASGRTRTRAFTARPRWLILPHPLTHSAPAVCPRSTGLEKTPPWSPPGRSPIGPWWRSRT